MNKICTKCLVEKTLDGYYFVDKEHTKIRPTCKECDRDYNKTNQHRRRKYCQKWRNRNKKSTQKYNQKEIEKKKVVKLKAIEYKGGGCVKCGYKKCEAALEFHHLDPKEKEFLISSKHCNWDIIKKELDKCILVCSNCHRETHSL